MSGLSNIEQDFYLGLLATSERIHEEAEKICVERKGYSYIIQTMTKEFSDALKKKDYKSCFLILKKLPKSIILNFMQPIKYALFILHC